MKLIKLEWGLTPFICAHFRFVCGLLCDLPLWIPLSEVFSANNHLATGYYPLRSLPESLLYQIHHRNKLADFSAARNMNVFALMITSFEHFRCADRDVRHSLRSCRFQKCSVCEWNLLSSQAKGDPQLVMFYYQ